MSKPNDDKAHAREAGFNVRSDWGVGPRTAAWDRLWRRMLGGLGPIPATDAREALESDFGDA